MSQESSSYHYTVTGELSHNDGPAQKQSTSATTLEPPSQTTSSGSDGVIVKTADAGVPGDVLVDVTSSTSSSGQASESKESNQSTVATKVADPTSHATGAGDEDLAAAVEAKKKERELQDAQIASSID